MFNFPELLATRQSMLDAFRAEEARTDLAPYRPKDLAPAGVDAWPKAIEAAITQGNEMTLKHDLDFAPYWRQVKGARTFPTLAHRAATDEFNTWYVRGLCLRLLDEGVDACVVYPAESAKEGCDECTALEGTILTVKQVYEGHRIRYHHVDPDRTAVSIPPHEKCHHSIKRVSEA